MSNAVTTITQPVPAVHDLYRHYKCTRSKYLVLAIATHSETQEQVVVYMSLDYGKIWVRPLEVWNQFVNVPTDDNPDHLVPRFFKIQGAYK